MDADLFIQQFGHLAQSEGGIKKLREVILQLAVCGRLVEQNPQDEPAAILLKKIEHSKKQLIKEGKIKNPKKISEITPDEQPFVIPKNWLWTKLGNLGNIFNGDSINANEKELKYSKLTTGYNYIATKDISYSSRKIDYDNGIKIPFESNKFKIAHKGAVLICAEGGSAGKKIAITEEDICFGNKLYAIEIFSDFLPQYLFYVYQSSYFFQEFSSTTTGIIGGTSINKFNNIPIPVPPLAEQKRIVAKIDELMTLCNQLELEQQKQLALKTQAVQATLHHLADLENPADFGTSFNIIEQNFDKWFDDLSTVKRLRSSILQLAIQGKLTQTTDCLDQYLSSLCQSSLCKKDIYDIPNNWGWTFLEKILCFGPQNGYSPKAVDYTTTTKSLTLSATTKGTFDGSKFKYIDEVIPVSSHLWLENEDILIQRGNSAEYVGVSAVYYGDTGKYIYPDLMMKIRTIKEISTQYIYIVLSSDFIRNYFLRNATGTSGSMPKINQNVVKKCPVPLPPLAEQKRIVAKVDELMALCDQLEKQIIQTKNLNSNLMDSLINRITEAA